MPVLHGLVQAIRAKVGQQLLENFRHGHAVNGGDFRTEGQGAFLLVHMRFLGKEEDGDRKQFALLHEFVDQFLREIEVGVAAAYFSHQGCNSPIKIKSGRLFVEDFPGVLEALVKLFPRGVEIYAGVGCFKDFLQDSEILLQLRRLENLFQGGRGLVLLFLFSRSV